MYIRQTYYLFIRWSVWIKFYILCYISCYYNSKRQPCLSNIFFILLLIFLQAKVLIWASLFITPLNLLVSLVTSVIFLLKSISYTVKCFNLYNIIFVLLFNILPSLYSKFSRLFRVLLFSLHPNLYSDLRTIHWKVCGEFVGATKGIICKGEQNSGEFIPAASTKERWGQFLQARQQEKDHVNCVCNFIINWI